MNEYTDSENKLADLPRGSFAFSSNDILHGFSLFECPHKKVSEVMPRIRAFADFIDALVLSERVLYDTVSDSDNLIDVTTENIRAEHGLGDVLLPFEIPTIPQGVTDKSVLAPIFQQCMLEHLGVDHVYEQLVLKHFNDELLDLFDSCFVHTVDWMGCNPDYLPLFQEFGIEKDELIDEVYERWTNIVTPRQVRVAIGAGFFAFIEKEYSENDFLGIPTFSTSLKSQFLRLMPQANAAHTLVKKLELKRSKEAERLAPYYFGSPNHSFPIPLLLNYLLAKVDTFQGLIAAALDMRESKAVKAYRKWCVQLDTALEEGKQNQALEMVASAEAYLDNLGKEFHLPNELELEFSITPSISLTLPTPKAFCRQSQFALLKSLYDQSLIPTALQNKAIKVFKLAI